MVGTRNFQITIGEHGAWTPDKARKELERLLRELGAGNDPRANRVVGATFADAATLPLDAGQRANHASNWATFRRRDLPFGAGTTATHYAISPATQQVRPS